MRKVMCTYLPAGIMLICLFPACRIRMPTQTRTNTVPVDIAQLTDPSKSYEYTINYEFMESRSAYGFKFLVVKTEMAFFDKGTDTFCIKGQAVDGVTHGPLENVRVMVGTIKPVEAQVIPDGRSRPVPIAYYRISPHHEYDANIQGEFDVCTHIEPGSYLFVVTKGVLFQLYHIGMLVDTTTKSSQ